MAHITIFHSCFSSFGSILHAAIGADDSLYTLRPPELTAINHFKELSLEDVRAQMPTDIGSDDSESDGFQELSLENNGDDDGIAHNDDLDEHLTPREHNIYKIARNNRVKMDKAMPSTEAFLSSGYNGSIFSHITIMYDQFHWSMSDIGKLVTRKCANEMATYLRALEKGQSWALQGICSYMLITFS